MPSCGRRRRVERVESARLGYSRMGLGACRPPAPLPRRLPRVTQGVFTVAIRDAIVSRSVPGELATPPASPSVPCNVHVHPDNPGVDGPGACPVPRRPCVARSRFPSVGGRGAGSGASAERGVTYIPKLRGGSALYRIVPLHPHWLKASYQVTHDSDHIHENNSRTFLTLISHVDSCRATRRSLSRALTTRESGHGSRQKVCKGVHHHTGHRERARRAGIPRVPFRRIKV